MRIFHLSFLLVLLRLLPSCAVPPANPILHVETIRAGSGNLVPEGTVLETRSYYLNPAGEKVQHGLDTQFLENGNKYRESHYRDGVLDGALVEWDPLTGDKVREESFRTGLQEGTAVRWHSKDRKASECIYHAGRIVGKALYWDSDGRLEMEEVYDDAGHLAELTVWHPNGQPHKHGHFNGVWPDVWGGPQLAGKRDGTWTYRDPDGNLTAEGTWKDGKPQDGTCVVPRQSGSLFVGDRGTYHQGKLIGPVTQTLDF
jgi:antitoxin component YwqK of YwqJK toxin-antitoxin module